MPSDSPRPPEPAEPQYAKLCPWCKHVWSDFCPPEDYEYCPKCYGSFSFAKPVPAPTPEPVSPPRELFGWIETKAAHKCDLAGGDGGQGDCDHFGVSGEPEGEVPPLEKARLIVRQWISGSSLDPARVWLPDESRLASLIAEALRAAESALAERTKERDEAMEILAPGQLTRMDGTPIPTGLVERTGWVVMALDAEAAGGDEARAELSAARQEREKLADLLEFGWGVIANAGGGNWTLETPEWQEAAARWRDRWLATLKGGTPCR